MIDSLIKEGKLQADSRADVAYAVVGVGVRAGAPKPDIRTLEAFKRALLNAKQLPIPRPAPAATISRASSSGWASPRR